jgi:predicted ATPase/DNA-binding XRE family transcriptional regulator
LKAAFPVSFAARLKSLRETAGFTQDELATIAGLSVHAVSALERGHRKRPQAETIRSLAVALDLDPNERDHLARLARGAGDDDGHGGEGLVVPLPPTPLVGRDADVRAVRSWLAETTGRLVTVTGPGGAGKTRVALQVASDIERAGESRVCVAFLADLRSPGFVPSAIAEALGIADVGCADLPRCARTALGDTPTLILVDNLEHLLDATPLLTDLLTAVRTLRVLATSRAPLRLRGEREYVLGPLAMVGKTPDRALAPALELFVDRVRDVRPGFAITAENLATVASICQRLDALPLALELAAPWVKVLTVDELDRRLANDILLPAAGARDLPERQQTMNATVAWSCRLLGPAERDVFQRLGLLPGPFSIEAAAAVLAGRDGATESTDYAIAVVGDLIDKSLVQRADGRDAGRPVFRMLETVRAYAAAELAASGERDDAMEGLARHYAAEAARAAVGLVGLDQIEWLDRVRDEVGAYRTLLEWLIDEQRPAEAAQVACHLMFFWIIRGHAIEGFNWYQKIADSPLVAEVAEGQSSFAAAVTLYAQGELVGARTWLRRALPLAQAAGDTWTVVQIENLLGHVARATGRLDDARTHFAAGLAGFRAAGRPGATMLALGGLAWVAIATGAIDEAERYLDEADEIGHVAGPWFLMLPLYLRAVVAVRRGDADRAIALTRANLVHTDAIHDQFIVVYALVPFAAAAALKGDDEWAARILGVRDAVATQGGSRVSDPSVTDLAQHAERDVRKRLGAERWARAFHVGQTSTIAALIDEIDLKLPTLRE